MRKPTTINTLYWLTLLVLSSKWRPSAQGINFNCPTISDAYKRKICQKILWSFSLSSSFKILNNAKNNVHVTLTIIDARCVARPAPKTTDSEEHRMERKANNLGCGASLDYGEERND